MSKKSTLEFKASIATSPIYTSDETIEAAKIAYGPSKIIEMGANESPLEPSPRVIEAIRQAAATLNRYPPMGDELLRRALADSLGRGVSPEQIVTGNGGVQVLEMIATAFLNPGDAALICRPTFPVYEITARRAGADITYIDLEPESFAYDVKVILAAITPQTKIIYVCSPNNPTGRILLAEQMEQLVNQLPPHILIVADEVYHHFVTDDNFPDSLAYVNAEKNVVILHSFSKAYGLAGLRLGYAIAPVEIAHYLSRARKPFHLSKMTVEGGLAAQRDQDHVDKTVELVIEGREWLYEQLVSLGLPTWPSQGNFVLFKPPFAADEVSDRLLQHGIVVRAMTQFYLPAHVRVTVGLPHENEQFINILGKILTAMEAEGRPKPSAGVQEDAEFKF